jgi:hypothetical protein
MDGGAEVSSPPRTARRCAVCAVSHAVVFWTAAGIWFLGVWATEDTSTTLLTLALSQGVSVRDAIIAYSVSGICGILSGILLFARLAKKNVERFGAIEEPRLYDCYRPQFILMLCVFDGGTILAQTYLATGPTSRLVMGSVNLVVCVGLASSLLYIFFLWRTFRKAPNDADESRLQIEQGDFSSIARGLLSPDG